MKRKLEDIFTLLNTWQQYVDIIYAPEAEMRLRDILRNQGRLGQNGFEDVDLEEDSFAAKLEQETIDKRLEQLLRREEPKDLEAEKEKINDNMDDPY